MFGADDEMPDALPPSGQRSWVHPSEQHPRTTAAPAPTRRTGDTSTVPSSPICAAGRFRRIRRLPIGTAIVATATGAVVMYGAFTVFGLDVVRDNGSVTTAGAPVANEPSASATIGLANARTPATPTATETPGDVVLVRLGQDSKDGVVTAAGVLVVVAPDDQVWFTSASLISVTDQNQTTFDAHVVSVDPARGVVMLSVPMLSTPAAIDPVMTRDKVFRRTTDGDVVAAGEIASTSTGWTTSSPCWPIVYGPPLAAGTVLLNADGVALGLVAAADPDANDALVAMVPVTGWTEDSTCAEG